MNRPDYGYLVHPRRRADLTRLYPSTRLLPEPVMEGLLPFLPPFRLGFLDIGPGPGGRGLAIGLPLLERHLAREDNPALRRRLFSVIDLAGREGCAVLGLSGRLGEPPWSTLAAGRFGGLVTTGEAMEIAAVLGGLRAAAGPGFRSWTVTIVLDPGRRLYGETLAILLAREVEGILLAGSGSGGRSGRRPGRTGVTALAGRILADSGLVAEVQGVTGAFGPSDAAIFLDDPGPESIRGLKSGAIAVDLTGGRRLLDRVSEIRRDLRLARGAWVGMTPPAGFVAPRFLRTGSGGLLLLPPALAESILEAARPDRRPLSPIARPSVTAPPTAGRVEWLIAQSRRRGLALDHLRWDADVERPGRAPKTPKVGFPGRKAGGRSEVYPRRPIRGCSGRAP